MKIFKNLWYHFFIVLCIDLYLSLYTFGTFFSLFHKNSFFDIVSIVFYIFLFIELVFITILLFINLKVKNYHKVIFSFPLIMIVLLSIYIFYLFVFTFSIIGFSS